MKILYDYQTFSEQRFGGISNSFVRLIENLPDNFEYEIALRESDNVHLRESSLKVNYTPRRCYEESFISRRNFKGRKFLYRHTTNLFPFLTTDGINRRCSIKALIRNDFDVFHPTFFHPYFLPYLGNKPFVLTVHDMIPELYFSKKELQVKNKPLLCHKAAHIVAVSENTKKDLIQMLHMPEEKISVIYHGAPDFFYDAKSEPIVNGRYLLYVGQRELYKNFLPMVQALVPVMLRHEEIKIICTGNPFTASELSSLREMGMAERVMHLHVNDVELQNLYSHALCFIYPSVYEGFGIPILEAYAARCPVLLNHASCFPEIAQDAAVYFHLHNSSSDLEQVMEQFLALSPMEHELLLQRQLNRLQYFSWQKSSRQLADIYTMVVEKYT